MKNKELSKAEYLELEKVIKSQAKKLSKGNSFLYEELIAEGYLGYAKALKDFNPAKGSALLTWCISRARWAQFGTLELYIQNITNISPLPDFLAQEQSLDNSEIKEEILDLIKVSKFSDRDKSMFIEYLVTDEATLAKIAEKYGVTAQAVKCTINKVTSWVKRKVK